MHISGHVAVLYSTAMNHWYHSELEGKGLQHKDYHFTQEEWDKRLSHLSAIHDEFVCAFRDNTMLDTHQQLLI